MFFFKKHHAAIMHRVRLLFFCMIKLQYKVMWYRLQKTINEASHICNDVINESAEGIGSVILYQ